MRRSIFNAYVMVFVAFVLLTVVIVATRIAYEGLSAFTLWLALIGIPQGTLYIVQHPFVLVVFVLVGLFFYCIPWDGLLSNIFGSPSGSPRNSNHRRGRYVNSADGALSDAYQQLVQQQRRRRRQATMRPGTPSRKRRRR